MLLVKAALIVSSVSNTSSMPTENCRLVSRLRYSVTLDSGTLITWLLRIRVGRYSMCNHGKELCKVWMGELKHGTIVTWMDACYWIQFPQSVNLTQLLQRQKTETSSSVQGCQNSDLNCRKTEKSSQTKLATGACKSWTFFAVDNFPPRIPVTMFPLYLAPVAGQPEPPPFGPCCSCSFYWPRDAFLKFSQSYQWHCGLLI